MALSANRQVPTYQGAGIVITPIVDNGVQIYQGALCSILMSSGELVIPTSASASTVQQFAGIALEKVLGDAVKTCKVLMGGYFWHALGSGTVADIGKKVYSASDSDDTITLTGTVNVTQCVGTIVGYDAAKDLFLIQSKRLGENIDAIS